MLAAIAPTPGLPVAAVEFVVIGPGRHHAAVTALIEAILASTAELRGL